MVLTVLYIVSALDALSFSMTITTMGPYVLSLGGSHFFMGLMGSACALLALLWNPISGSLGDQFGRKIMLLQSLLVGCVSNMLMVLSTSLVIIFIARILCAFGSQIITFVKSMMDDNIESKDDTMKAINKTGAISGICFIFGALAAGFLSELSNGITYVFLIISLIFAINFALVYSIKEKPKKSPPKIKDTKTEKTDFKKEIKSAIQNLVNIDWPKYWDIFAVRTCAELILGMFHFNFGIILTEQFGMTGKSFGYVVALLGVTGIVTNLALAKVKEFFYSADEDGFSRLLHGNLLLAATFLALSNTTDFTYYFAFLIVMHAAKMLLDTTLTEILLGRANEEEKGSVIATFDSTMPLAGLVAPLLSGIILDQWGASAMMVLCSLPALASAVITYTLKDKTEKID